MNLVFAVCTEDSTNVANEKVSARLTRLRNHIQRVQAATTPTFIVFVAPEFMFMHGHAGSDRLRWYSKAERDKTLKGLAAASRLFGRLLLVGGSICWAKTEKNWGEKTDWVVRNEAPVHYNGNLLALYGKRHGGGEVYAEDTLRLYRARRGVIDLQMYDPNGVDAFGNRLYNIIQATGNMGQLASLTNNTVRRGPGGAALPAAPGINAAKDRYDGRIRFIPGTDEPSFDIPGGTLTGGVEICQEHNLAALQNNSGRGRTNFHLLTSNTVGHNAAHENLVSPGYFVHAKAGCPPELVTLSGVTRTVFAAHQWTQLDPTLHYIEVPMPVGL